jgi:hypothetical protein
MRGKNKSQLWTVVLEFPKGLSRSVQVKASSREVAENRALKRNPSAIGVKRAS